MPAQTQPEPNPEPQPQNVDGFHALNGTMSAKEAGRLGGLSAGAARTDAERIAKRLAGLALGRYDASPAVQVAAAKAWLDLASRGKTPEEQEHNVSQLSRAERQALREKLRAV